MEFKDICAVVGEDTFRDTISIGIKPNEKLVELNFGYLQETKADLIETLVAENKKHAIYNMLTSYELQKKIEICDLLGIDGETRLGLMRSFSFEKLMQTEFNIHLLEFFIEKLGKDTIKNIISLEGAEGKGYGGLIDLEKIFEAEKLRNQLINLCSVNGIPGGWMAYFFEDFLNFDEEKKKRQITFLGGCFREIRYMVETCKIDVIELLKRNSEDIIQYAGLLRNLSNEYAIVTNNQTQICDFDVRGKFCPFTVDQILHPYVMINLLKRAPSNIVLYTELLGFLHGHKVISETKHNELIELMNTSYNLSKEIPEKNILAKLPFSRPLGVYDKQGIENMIFIINAQHKIPAELTYSRELYKCTTKLNEYMIATGNTSEVFQKIWFQVSKWSITQQVAFFNLINMFSYKQLDLFFAYRTQQPNKKRRESVEGFLNILQLIKIGDETIQQLVSKSDADKKQENIDLINRFIIQYATDGEGRIVLPIPQVDEKPCITTQILTEMAQNTTVTPEQLVKNLDKYYDEGLVQSIDNLLFMSSGSHREYMTGRFIMLYKYFLALHKTSPTRRAKIGLIMQTYKTGKRDYVRSNISSFPIRILLNDEGENIILESQIETKYTPPATTDNDDKEKKEEPVVPLISFAVEGVDDTIRQHLQQPQNFSRDLAPLSYQQQRFNIKSGFEELRDPDIYDESIRELLFKYNKKHKDYETFVQKMAQEIPYDKLLSVMPIIKYAEQIDAFLSTIPKQEITAEQHTPLLKEAQILMQEIYKTFSEKGHEPGMIRCEEYATHFALDSNEGSLKVLNQLLIREPIQTQTHLTNDLCLVLQHMRGCTGLKGGSANVNLDYLLPNRFFLYSQDMKQDADLSIADQIVTILPSPEYGPMYVLDTLYGLRNKDILINHIMTIYNQAVSVQQHITLPVFIPYSTISSAGTNEKDLLETLTNYIPSSQIISKASPTLDLTYAGYKEFDIKKGGIMVTLTP